MNKCTKPDCDCIAKAEEKAGGPVKNYPCLASVFDLVNKPPHYLHGTIEPISVIEDWKLDFCTGNAIKYISRAAHKGNEKQDLEKAVWYLQRKIATL